MQLIPSLSRDDATNKLSVQSFPCFLIPVKQKLMPIKNQTYAVPIFFMYCLFFVINLSAQTPSIQYNSDYCTFLYKDLPPLANFMTKPQAKWGLFLWEFGNGDYYLTDNPNKSFKQPFSARPRFRPELHVTPYYSQDVPISVPMFQAVEASKNCRASYDCDLLEKNDLVEIVTNAREDIIPNHEIRVVVHYKAPANLSQKSEGYLLFFYNKSGGSDEVATGFDPILYQKNKDKLYGGQKKISPNRTISDISLNLNNRNAIQKIAKMDATYKNVNIYESTIERGEERRLFFSIKGNEQLKRATEKGGRVSIAAVWLPKTGAFNEKYNVAEQSMKLLNVHDPNRIGVDKKRLYYKKNSPKDMTYTVDFQNEGDGIVNKVVVKILNNEDWGITNPNQITIEKTKPKCKPCQRTDDRSRVPCMDKSLSFNGDTILFTFHNIGLAGEESEKKGWFKKYTKGSFDFRVNSTNKRTNKTKVQAGIYFDNVPPVYTNHTKTKWRHCGLSLKAGINFGSAKSNYSFEPENILDRMAIGLIYHNEPIGTGFNQGVELSYSTFRFLRDTITEGNDDIPAIVYSENIRLQFLDLLYHHGFQIAFGEKAWLSIKAKGGVSMPAAMDVTIQANTESNFPISAEETLGFDFFNTEETTIFNELVSPRRFWGLVGGLGIEIGDMNNFAIGVQNQVRYYPRFYYGENCFHLNNVEFYVRLKLATIGL